MRLLVIVIINLYCFSVGLSALERAAGAVQDVATGNVVTRGTNANQSED